ncbi:MAG: peptidase M4 family protein [Acidobacteria bacterium]|nr:MAG: peptidase M4 family protein [Acidobacteriota bacterium]
MRRHCIVPPHILRAIAANGTERQQALAWATMTDSDQFRGQRALLATLAVVAAVPAGTKRRTIYDAGRGYTLPGLLVRGEGNPRGKDVAVNEAYDGSGATYDLYAKVFDRNSIDGRGMRLDSTVHYGKNYDNAFWNGRQMVYGDGDGQVFGRFTKALDVIGHELTHGVTQFEAALVYRDESGALNESISDVFGSLVKQHKLGQSVTGASWLIGEGLFLPGIAAKGLRSMKAPGTAYDDPLLGKDPQPGHIRDYVRTLDDNGGVHINSGIPNRAFYELAARLGGNAWEKAGQIWYRTLRTRLEPNATFHDAARATFAAAGELYGSRSKEQAAVRAAWAEVGLSTS